MSDFAAIVAVIAAIAVLAWVTAIYAVVNNITTSQLRREIKQLQENGGRG